jgi:hypothetical protein
MFLMATHATPLQFSIGSLQLGVTRFEENQNRLNRKIYFKLIKEFEKVPESCRKKVASALKRGIYGENHHVILRKN